MTETAPTSESLEVRVERLIVGLAEQEGMPAEDIMSDIITFAPHPENESSNPDYLEEVAERLGISIEEMNAYALKKYEENQAEE